MEMSFPNKPRGLQKGFGIGMNLTKGAFTKQPTNMSTRTIIGI